MQRTRYTPAEKAEALELLAEFGKTEASRRTGISAGTIASWGSRSGVSGPTPEAMARQVEARRAAWAERRAILADRIGEVADQATEQLAKLIASGECSASELTRAIAVLVDRAQLLSGGATERTETTVTRQQRIEEARQRAERHLTAA
jgi:transposase-like protein